MTQERAKSSQKKSDAGSQKTGVTNHYTLLGLHPSASVREIRKAYRDLSKLYHPDTTQLSAAIATEKFRQLNEAYATLSNPDRRQAYDQKIGYSRVVVSQPLPSLNQPKSSYSSSAYLDPTDRPFSAGELFALFILGITFVACLILAIAIGLTRGEKAFQPLSAQEPVPTEAQTSDTENSQTSTEDNEASEIKQTTKFPFFPVKAPEIKPSPASRPDEASDLISETSPEPEIKKAAKLPLFPVKTPEIKSNSENQPSEGSHSAPATNPEPEIKKAARSPLFPVKPLEPKSSPELNSTLETDQDPKSQSEKPLASTHAIQPEPSQEAPKPSAIEATQPSWGNSHPETSPTSSFSIDSSNSAL